MIPLGIFAKTFSRPTIHSILGEVAALDLGFIQFNFSCMGLPALPEKIDTPIVEQIREATGSHKIQIAAISGTFNLIDPDLEQRDQNFQRLGVLAAACEPLQTSVITLCTGTRDPEDMWRAHPENASSSAWKEMVEGTRLALWITEPFGVTLAVEPEPGNVMSDVRKARRLLDEVGSPRLKIVFDAANIVAATPDRPQAEALDEAFKLLDKDIVLAHGKEFVAGAGAEKIPGQGDLNWELYLRLLSQSSYKGPLILHGFGEAHARESVAFVRSVLERLHAAQ